MESSKFAEGAQKKTDGERLLSKLILSRIVETEPFLTGHQGFAHNCRQGHFGHASR